MKWTLEEFSRCYNIILMAAWKRRPQTIIVSDEEDDEIYIISAKDYQKLQGATPKELKCKI